MRRLSIGVLFAGLAGCSVSPAPVDAAAVHGDAPIYVVGRGWHTDIGLPVDEIGLPLAALEHDFPGVRFLVFGFGERAYYMGHNPTSGDMLAALFPSDSAILMTALNTQPTAAFPDEDVVTLHVTQDSVDRIASRIWQTVQKQPDGSLRRLADGPYPGSVFYASGETYDLFHTCNSWTAITLRDAGVPVDPTGVVFVDQIMRQVRQIATLQGR